MPKVGLKYLIVAFPGHTHGKVLLVYKVIKCDSLRHRINCLVIVSLDQVLSKIIQKEVSHTLSKLHDIFVGHE